MDFLNVQRSRTNDEGFKTVTSQEQIIVENSIESIFRIYAEKIEIDPDAPVLLAAEHIDYLTKSLTHLPSTYICLDASRTWMCYWICHSLNLMKHQLPDQLKTNVFKFLERCQSPQGGFGGGPGQAPHLASTYAAVNALCCLNSEEALRIINRETLLNFLWSTKCKSGAFCLEVDGEVDIRGAYCAASVASLINLKTDKLFQNTAEWIVACQTYEGGFSGCPGMEAHGGYTFCGVAALTLLNSMHLCDMKALLRWCVNKQTSFEGGFQGRTNKLVDGCYSFWQGAVFSVMYANFNLLEDEQAISKHLFSHRALQEYILICCQHPSGGLLDKPGKPRDVYHSCYTLSGLSVSQHLPSSEVDVVGQKSNLLMPVHPLYNLVHNCVKFAMQFFRNA
ncbi:protein farnesyltransferase subunit beta [Planococcus citri]|uniref:protein farnesyltransferase subunit beta n=1 Tax=Planococcus citri TaxID=170843 RepID=UPI0031F79A7A